MGCCESTTIDIIKHEFVSQSHISKHTNSEFIDLSLSSESYIPELGLESWRQCKLSESKSVICSVGISSTFIKSDRKVSYYSKSASIVDSFCCTPLAKLE
ncbi:hypothetical protein SteCoe_25587 [Stentor coeruleus]|uniref:Uncharacterized protein n=1 Tax=Stentor coeruleus TaxID=5963 RepID=A0A1R2BEW2_9CILI|nr:hypothetical protein SteCoe_25587 [Stentor coeruleus]